MPTRSTLAVDWLNAPLASVVINATPEDSLPRFSTEKVPLVTALEVRAAYRLIGALFMVGGGARNDAIGLIDDLKCTYSSSLLLLSIAIHAIYKAFPYAKCLKAMQRIPEDLC